MRTLSINVKCSDMFSAVLLRNDNPEASYDGYVPKWFPNPRVQHFGDYVELVIDIDTGRIVNWQKPTAAQLSETFNFDNS